MKTVGNELHLKFDIHDWWTETLEGLVYLIDQIQALERNGDTLKKLYLTRLTIISSTYLAEQVFAISVQKFITGALAVSANTLVNNLLANWKERYSIKRVGISRAMEEWPKELTGKPLDFGKEPLLSLKILIKKRNDIIHRLYDTTRYDKAIEIARSAFYTAIEASKTIEAHFFPDKDFSYQGWLDKFQMSSRVFFCKLRI
jgi:hypothetical protein